MRHKHCVVVAKCDRGPGLLSQNATVTLAPCLSFEIMVSSLLRCDSYFWPVEVEEMGRSYDKPNKLLSVFLGVLTTIFLLIFIILSVLHSTSVTPIVKDVIDDTYIAYHLETFDYHNEYYIWYQINGLYFNETHVTYDDLEVFIKSDAVSEEIGNMLDGYVRALAAGDFDHHITTGDVIIALENIKPELNDLFDHQMTDENIESLAGVLNDILDFDTMSISGMMDELDIELPVPHFLISTNLLVAAGIISLIMLGLIIFLYRKDLPGGFLYAGIPIASAGLIAFISAVWLNAFSESLSQTVHRLAIHIEGPASKMNQYGLIFTAAGVLIIVISFLLKRISRQPQTKPEQGKISSF